MVAAMFLIGIGLTGLLEGVLIQEQGLVQAMTTQRDLLAKEKLQWQDRLALRHSQERRAKALTEGRESVAGPFLGYLGNVIPNELVLTKVSLVHDVEGWKVELMGTAPSNLTATPQTLGQLENRLAEGPFHLQINPDWRQQWLQGVKVGKKEIGRSSFEMSGRIP